MRDFRKTLQVHDGLCCSQYSVPPIRDIGGPTKSKLLGSSSTYATEAHSILAALKAGNKATCALLVLATNLHSGCFKVSNPQSTHMPDNGIESFIVLSHTWHSPAWKPHWSIVPLSRRHKRPSGTWDVASFSGSATGSRLFLARPSTHQPMFRV